MKCRFVNDKKGRWFYPQCMGGAVYGLNGCTCGASRVDRYAQLERRIKALEQKADNPQREEGRDASR